LILSFSENLCFTFALHHFADEPSFVFLRADEFQKGACLVHRRLLVPAGTNATIFIAAGLNQETRR
jgi:hypothetical protein